MILTLTSNCQDEGVYTYIDQSAAKVLRTTRMNNPDVVLSAEQNDVIHSVALKQIAGSRFAADAGKATTVNTTPVATGSSGDTFAAHASGHAAASAADDEDEDMEDEDDTCLDPQPFASLFGRMARPDAKERAAPTSSNAPATAAAKKAKTTQQQRKAKTAKGDVEMDEAPGDLFGLGRLDLTSDQGKEDSALVEGYIKQYKKLKALDAAGMDDQTFGPWSRSRIQKLQELRAGIKSKQKSLKRRTTDSTDLKKSLDEICDTVSDLITFIKKLAAGNIEGRETFDELSALVSNDDEYMPSNEVWKRCIRGMAFEENPVV